MIKRFAIFRWIRNRPIWSALIILVAALILYKVLAPSEPTYEYVAMPVDRGAVTRIVSASGKIRALNTIKVGSEISGQVSRVFVDYNSQVLAGQPLAEIDPTRVAARVTQAEAQVDLARAALAQAEAGLARARTDIEIQNRDYHRRKELAARGFTSKTGLDQAANTVAAAQSGLKTAQAGVISARAQIRQREAELQSAKLDLTRTRIIAPASGTVINKLVEPGATVAASFQTPNLFEIASDMRVMQVEASVDEADIGEVRVGQPVRFTVDAYPDQPFAATVRQIRTSASEAQNVVSYFVILQVQNPEGKLLPGMTANVEIVTGARAGVLRVPSAALRFRPRPGDRPNDETTPAAGASRSTTVWLASADPYKPERRTVRVGMRSEEFVEIVGGVKPGERVLLRSRSLEKKAEEEPDDEEAQEEGR
ncbi:efflux RND transporter periplasmic adaptor subunit [Allosphingosinicella deserti]|uniref:Efflux RND transporter periplasmic adaptor subunit n=1 Tax=Allosphingosinicella deserti TaxID=2116704 RepID=A0A2P7QHI0_9SPHN|nr:efflux RND transporter periplasmic adaptor subunit [Sphingomonas deserti]PSJ37415.1 efflux RND transporter periplasmic adaptor subunit [Sphingomonas deserti]